MEFFIVAEQRRNLLKAVNPDSDVEGSRCS